jgi:hypothetical protein
MKRLIISLSAVLVMLSFSPLFGQEGRKIDWKAYSTNLIEAIKSSNEGLQLSAMQKVIKSSDSLDVALARYVVMDVFMNNKDQKVRQLALATLIKIDNPLDIGLLELHLKWEENEELQKMIKHMLVEKGRMKAKKD